MVCSRHTETACGLAWCVFSGWHTLSQCRIESCGVSGGPAGRAAVLLLAEERCAAGAADTPQKLCHCDDIHRPIAKSDAGVVHRPSHSSVCRRSRRQAAKRAAGVWMHGLHALVGMHHAGHSLPRDADSGKPNLSKSVQQDAGGARLMAGRSSRQEMHVGDDRGG